MANKTAEKKQKTAHKKMAKAIISVKNVKTGAYSFKEKMVLAEEISKVLAQSTT